MKISFDTGGKTIFFCEYGSLRELSNFDLRKPSTA